MSGMSKIDRAQPVDAGVEKGAENAVASLLATLKENPGALKTVSREDLATLAHLLDQQVEQIDRDADRQQRDESRAQSATEEQQRREALSEKYNIYMGHLKLAEDTLASLKQSSQAGDDNTPEIPLELAENENFALDALKANENAWDHLPENLRRNEAFQERVLRQSPYLFQKFDADTQTNEKIARIALQENSYANYEYLPDTLKQNEDFIFSALRDSKNMQNVELLETLRSKKSPLASNKAFIMRGLDKGIDMTIALSDDLSGDREIFLKASKLSASAINQASPELRGDKEFLSQCLDVVLAQPNGRRKANDYFLREITDKKIAEALRQRIVGLE